MIEKIQFLVGSIRFQQAFVVLVLQILAFYQVLPQEVINYISIFFGVSILLGSADSVALKIAKK